MTKVASPLVSLFLLLSTGLFAQIVVNGDLEYWEIQNPNSAFLLKENPKTWTTRNHVNDNPQAVFCYKSTDSYSGQRAAILQNYSNGNGFSLSSFMSLGEFDADNPSQRGVAFTWRPYALHFAYKYFTLEVNPDGFYKSGARIELSKWDDATEKRILIGKGEYSISDKTNFYRSTTVVINYFSTEEPDSMQIVFNTSNNPDDEVRLTIDDVYLQMEQNTVGANDKLYVDEVSLFPNPVENWLSFSNPLDINDASIHVYNAIGQLLIEQSITGTGGKIDCNDLNEGMYFYQIRRSDELVKSGKLMKI